MEESLTRIQGLAVGLIGLNGVIASMFTVDADGRHQATVAVCCCW